MAAQISVQYLHTHHCHDADVSVALPDQVIGDCTHFSLTCERLHISLALFTFFPFE